VIDRFIRNGEGRRHNNPVVRDTWTEDAARHASIVTPIRADRGDGRCSLRCRPTDKGPRLSDDRGLRRCEASFATACASHGALCALEHGSATTCGASWRRSIPCGRRHRTRLHAAGGRAMSTGRRTTGLVTRSQDRVGIDPDPTGAPSPGRSMALAVVRQRPQ